MMTYWSGRADVAVMAEGVTWSGARLMAKAAAAADWLDDQAVADDVVPLLASSSPAAIALTLGAAGSGRAVAPLSVRLTDHELAGMLSRRSAKALLTQPEHVELATRLVARAGGRMAVIPEFADSGRELDLDPRPGQTAFVLHTSGTTGDPKPVAMRQDRLAARARASAGTWRLGPGRRLLTGSGLHHVGGLGVHSAALASGTGLILLPRFSLSAWTAAIRHRPTHAVLVPTVIHRLLDAGMLAVPGLANLIYGAAPMHPHTLARVFAAMPDANLYNTYGQTEGAPITTLTPADHRAGAGPHPELLHTAGRAVADLELRISSPDRTGAGEVWARAAHLMSPGEDGWLRTGDLGCLNPEGYLRLVGRMQDKIIRGGENIMPLEVEAVLEAHPAVAAAAVVGLPDTAYGEVVKAFIVPAVPDQPPSFERLRGHVRQSLAGFKVPTEWELIDALPRGPEGKLQRRRLPR
jgi:acyl-CoA synthetase (AMP-forming)/AMP-acid ligase II